jgi:CHAT domain
VSTREVAPSGSNPPPVQVPAVQAGPPDPVLKITVSHGSFEQADYALMVPTYEDESFTGSERVLDGQLHGLLAANFDAGAYPGPLEGRSLFIAPRPDEDIESEPPGAYVVGLGQTADLSRDRVTYAVRQALVDRCTQLYNHNRTPTADGFVEVGLSSTLLGARTDNGLRIAESVAGIVEGVLEANKALATYEESRARASHPVTAPVRVTALELIERSSDRADLAAVAVRGIEHMVRLPVGYSDEHRSVTVKKKPGGLPAGAALTDDARQQWRRFSITSTSDSANTSGVVSFDISDVSGGARADRTIHSLDPVVLASLAQRLSAQTSDTEGAAALYDVLIPNEMRASFESLSSLQLILDETSANYPWELLSAPPQNGQASSPAHMSVIRQFSEIGLRRLAPVRAARGTALLIAAGSAVPAVPLPGPHKEAIAIGQQLKALYGDQAVQVVDDAEQPLDTAELMVVLQRGHQILHIAGHGEFRADDVARTGAVLNSEMRLRADTVQTIQRVPELVFINCCSLAEIGTGHLAAGLARAFMSIGARAVIAAGWRIDDDAAAAFANIFYEQFLSGESFGDSVAAGRHACAEAGGNETWAAYQCYGDPTYVLGGGLALQPATMTTAVGYDDLIRRLETLQTRAADLGRPGGGRISGRRAELLSSYQSLAAWANTNGYEQFDGSLEQTQRAVNAQRLLARVAAYIGEFRPAAERYLALLGAHSVATGGPTTMQTRSRWSSVEDLQQGSNLLSRAALIEWRGCAVAQTKDMLRAQMKHAVVMAREARQLVPENESHSILGGALKRLAVASTGAERRRLIAQAAAAYQGVDASPMDAVSIAQAEVYRRHNAYQLAVLIGADKIVRPTTTPRPAVPAALVDQSRGHNAEYWDNAVAGDAALTDLLMATKSKMANARQRMVRSYIDAFERRSTWRERASTIDHLRDLHDLLPDSDDRKSHLDQALQVLTKWENDVGA